MKQSWRTIILSRGKQGAKAMREFYRDLHKAHPDLEEKVREKIHINSWWWWVGHIYMYIYYSLLASLFF